MRVRSSRQRILPVVWGQRKPPEKAILLWSSRLLYVTKISGRGQGGRYSGPSYVRSSRLQQGDHSGFPRFLPLGPGRHRQRIRNGRLHGGEVAVTRTDDPDDGSTVLVQASSPGTPRLWFQFVSESKVVKNRVHLDLTCADVEAEVEGLARLGAHVLAERESLVTMADPSCFRVSW